MRSKSLDKPRAKYLILIITLLAFGLRVAFIEDRNLTIDENSSLQAIAGQSLAYIVTHYHTNTHMLTSVMAHLVDGLGHRLIFYRGPSAIFAVLTIPLLYQLGRRMLNESAGVLGALLLAIAPFHIDFSVQMRGYAAMAFWATVTFYCVWQGLQRAKLRTWAAFAIAGALATYAHLFGLLAVGASWLVVGLKFLIDRQFRQTPQALKAAGLSLVLLLVSLTILYGPLLTRIVNTPDVEQDWGTQIEPTFVDGHLNGAALQDYLKVLRLYGPRGEPNSWFVLSFVVVAGLGLGAIFLNLFPRERQKSQAGLAMALWIFAPMVVTVLGLQLIPGFYVFRRFFIFLQPIYLLFMAAGILFVAQQLAILFHRPLVGQAIVGFLVAASVGGAGWTLFEKTGEDIDNQWHRIAQTILAEGSNPLVICEPLGQKMEEKATHRDECYRNLNFYFQTELGQEVPWLHREVDKVASIPVASRLPYLEAQAGDVWLVLWDRDWPPSWPGLQQTPRLAGFEYYSIGSTLLIRAPENAIQLAALASIIDTVIPLETTPEDRFSYYLSQAQMKAVIGQRDQAESALFAAQAISPESLDAANQVRDVAELIGVSLEQ